MAEEEVRAEEVRVEDTEETLSVTKVVAVVMQPLTPLLQPRLVPVNLVEDAEVLAVAVDLVAVGGKK